MDARGGRASLQQLAQTSAFLSNSQIRILDQNEAVLADSGIDSQDQEYLWLPSLLEQFPGLELSGDDLAALLVDPQFRDEIPLHGMHGLATIPLSELPPAPSTRSSDRLIHPGAGK
ncbi:MAG: hypothetical protein R2844_01085 [Caldilineales bacterium]